MHKRLSISAKGMAYVVDCSVFLTGLIYTCLFMESPYELQFFGVYGADFLIQDIAFLISLSTPWLTQKLILDSPNGKRWFLVLYLSYLFYSLWYMVCGFMRQWFVSALYPVFILFCFLLAWRVMPTADEA